MPPKDYGLQPLDRVMTRLHLSNTDLVCVSTEQLTHKMVQKGRKGRRLTKNAQMKILKALQAVKPRQQFTLKQLFDYEAD